MTGRVERAQQGLADLTRSLGKESGARQKRAVKATGKSFGEVLEGNLTSLQRVF